jgi:hypothetical protein
MTRVSRGLLVTERRFLNAVAKSGSYGDPATKAKEKMEKLSHAPPHVWRDLEDFARNGYRGKVVDLKGHRLFTKEAQKEARWLATVANRARKGKLPESTRAWNHVLRALTTIYKDLGES